MFKFVIVFLALVAAAFAVPKPQYFYPSASYATYSNFAKPAATVYSSGYVPATYSAPAYFGPAAYSAAAYPAYAYL